jgi:hypothetical protein
MALKGTELKLDFRTGLTGSGAFGGSSHWNGTMSLVQSFTDGTTANKADLVYLAERTVAESTNDDLDLSGSLTDALGTTIAAAELVGVIVINKQRDGTENSSSLTIGGGSNAFEGFVGATGDTIGPISPGGMICLFNPDADGLGTVTAGTGDILRIANGAGGSNTYQIALLGRSA